MGTPANRVWERIQETARMLAEQKSLPSLRHAEAIVSQIVREESIELPPAYTMATLARALLREIEEAA
jgi:hypothetical protein